MLGNKRTPATAETTTTAGTHRTPAKVTTSPTAKAIGAITGGNISRGASNNRDVSKSRVASSFASEEALTVPKCEIFHLFDFNDFYGVKSL
jgi:hypothetical protein